MAKTKPSKSTRVIGSVKPPEAPAPSLIVSEEEVRRLPVIEESLEVTKEAVDRGGFRITKRVETHEQLVDELLESEHVEIERRRINTAVDKASVPCVRQEGDTLIVPVFEETLITVKQLVLVEEVRITRTKRTHRTPQTYGVRKESIEVERLDAEQPSAVKAT